MNSYPCDDEGVDVTRAAEPDDSPDDGLGGMRSLRRRLVGDGPSHVGGVADLGYGMGVGSGPFDRPPAEPVELDEDELPWELRGR